MKFKRSQLLSTNFVAGYLLFPPKNNSKRVKLGRQRSLQQAEGQLPIQVALVKQQVKTVASRNHLSQQAQPAKRRVFTIKELFEKYEDSYHNALYLEAIKFILEQIFWDSSSYLEE